jgi:HSP20 family protein
LSFERQMLNRLFGNPWSSEELSPQLSTWTPVVDVHEKDGTIHVTAELPGVEMKNVDVSLENNVLTLRGERRVDTEKDEKGYHWRERSFGAFQRSFTLPTTVDRDKVEANYKDGVLDITIPHKPEAKPRQIAIKAA